MMIQQEEQGKQQQQQQQQQRQQYTEDGTNDNIDDIKKETVTILTSFDWLPPVLLKEKDNDAAKELFLMLVTYDPGQIKPQHQPILIFFSP